MPDGKDRGRHTQDDTDDLEEQIKLLRLEVRCVAGAGWGRGCLEDSRQRKKEQSWPGRITSRSSSQRAGESRSKAGTR